jgi:exodeoxyribonuclease VII small subunit
MTKKVDFTKQYAELEKIVAWFEQENIDLEEGIKKFEEGIVIVKELKQYLGSVELKVKELKQLSNE